MSTTKVTYSMIQGAPVNVKDFGAIGDGVTDDRAAIQNAFDYAIGLTGGCTVIFPNGIYYLGTSYGIYSSLAVQLNLGTTTAGSASNINLVGQGAVIYQGAPGKLLGVFGANKVNISGFKFFGYTGGALVSTRGNDAIITVNYNSKNVNIFNNYCTNSLGDCIYLGGSLVSGGELGYQCESISIFNNVLKERYGNGTPSYLSGTKSRLAVAVIDAIGVSIQNNIIYGGVDLEPNLNSQHIVDVSISDNQFKSGNVTAQSTIGTNYWYDEPIVTTGGSRINQKITLTGTPGTPIVSSCVVFNNTFEYGYISFANIYKFDSIDGNYFAKGQIIAGHTSGTNYTSDINILNNIASNPLDSETTFIRLDGLVYYGNYSDNKATGSGFSYCINNNGASTGDGGRSIFSCNSLTQGTNAIGLTLASTSTELGNISTGPGSYNFAKFGFIQNKAIYTPTLTTTGYAAGTYSINWQSYPSNSIIVLHSSGGITVNITDVTNSLGDGQEITLISGSYSGGNTVIKYSASMLLKGGVDATMSASQNLTIIRRGGIWIEKCRSF